ncbi:MAG: hypothetical protein EA425_00470 [Puniceicoccaceae bacterium]|nr:MAG: hypothetical protein EA425_00470 [Puniceicoccaceae bacterium]
MQIDGNKGWHLQNEITRPYRAVAARSGNTTRHSTSWIATTVTGPGTLTYWRRVSSEANLDLLEVRVSNATSDTLIESVSGEADWAMETIEIDLPLPHTIHWEFKISSTTGQGISAAFLDEVVWEPRQTPGAIDASFAHRSTLDGAIDAMALGDDDSIYVGGNFSTLQGNVRNGIARLHPDGSLDTEYDPGAGIIMSNIRSLVLQPDGMAFMVGPQWIPGSSEPSIVFARYYPDGVRDPNFAKYFGMHYYSSGTSWMSGIWMKGIHAVAPQPDRKVLVGGSFTSYAGTSRNRILRLNPDGSLDHAFEPGAGADAWIRTVALQPDGKVLIGGVFTKFDGTARNRIARLHPNGSLDHAFDPGTGADDVVETITLQPDGKILISGHFTTFDGTVRPRIARLHPDGSLDGSFDPGDAPNDRITAIALQSDGKLLVSGHFTRFGGVDCAFLVRLHPDGSLDDSFFLGQGANDEVRAIAMQPDGKPLIGGDFTSFDLAQRNRIARLLPDGNLDISFDPGAGANDSVNAIALQSDGKVLIGGRFSFFDGTIRPHIARLNPGGSLDTSFDPGWAANGPVNAIALKSDGKVLIGGDFTSFDLAQRNRIARLNPDGSLDPAFNPGTGANGVVNTIALLPDGKTLLGGDFTSFGGTARHRIARLNPDGSLDPSFDPGGGADATVNAIALQADGRILLGGDFTSFDGEDRPRIVRLHPDGNLDASFDPGTGASSSIRSLALQTDGKILIGGSFENFDGIMRPGTARLHPDGSLDAAFLAAPSLPPFVNTIGLSHVNTIALQAEGLALLGGATGASTPRGPRLVRILTETLPRHTLTLTAANGTIDVFPQVESYAVGDPVVLTAVPNRGFEFHHWSEDLGGMENPQTITMTEDRSVTAHFRSLLDGLSPSGLIFHLGGDADWYLQSEYTRPGRPFAARSGNTDPNSISWIETTVTGPGILTFWRFVPSSPVVGSFRLSHNGEPGEPLSSVNWAMQTLEITEDGEHTLRWEYSRTQQATQTISAAFLDEITWTPTGGFYAWPLLGALPADRRGPLDRNGPFDLTNLLAYALGLDPRSATAADLPRLHAPNPETGALTFRYRRASEAPGVVLTPLVSETLHDWQPADTANLIVVESHADWELVELTLPAPASGRLFLLLHAATPN